MITSDEDCGPDFYPNPSNRGDDRVDFGPYDDAAEVMRGEEKGSEPVGGQPPHDEQPSAECQMLREENAKLLEFVRLAREYLGNVDPTHWVAKRLREGLPEGRDVEHRIAELRADVLRLMESLQPARALLERAMWAAAETDDEGFRAELESFLQLHQGWARCPSAATEGAISG